MIVVDVETGGLNPKEHPLLSVGAVDFFNPTNTFYGKCRSIGKTSTDEALKINGIDIIKWNSNMHPATMISEFLVWLNQTKDKTILAGHNPRFDLDFLYQTAKENKMILPFSYRTVDLHSVAYAIFTREGIKFDKLTADNIYKLLGMQEEKKPHNALIGAQMECMALRKLLSDERI